MNTITPDRIVELWPNLSQEARRRLVDFAERSVAGDDFELSAEDEQLLVEARADFENGRSVTFDEFKAEMDVLAADLRSGKRPAP